MTNSKSKDDEINFLFTCLENSKNLDLPAVVKALNLPNLKSAQNRLYSLRVKYGRIQVQSKTSKATAGGEGNTDLTPNTSPVKKSKDRDVLSPQKAKKVMKNRKVEDSPTKVAVERMARIKMEPRAVEEDSESDGSVY